LIKKGIKNGFSQMVEDWPKGSGPAWKKEFERLTKLDKKKKVTELKRVSFKAEAPAAQKLRKKRKRKKERRRKSTVRDDLKERVDTFLENAKKVREIGKAVAEEAAEKGLLRRKLWNVHVVARYDFGRRVADIETVDMQFSTRAFTEQEVRNDIDRLRVLWEENQQGVINGKSNWTFITYVSIDIVEARSADLANQPMLGARFHYKLLGDLDKININEGQCVPDYLLHEFSCNKRYFKNMDEKKIIQLLGGKKNGYTVNDIIDLAKTSRFISVHALTPMLEVFRHYKASEHTRINLCFIINNDHCYPILDKIFKKQIIYNNKLDLSDFTFEVKYDAHTYFSTEAEYLREKKDSKVCLVDTHNLSNLAHDVMNETGKVIQGMKFYYSALTSFEHPDGSIVEIAPDYILRREVCKLLHSRKPITEFVFRNQTWGALAKNIFRYEFDDLTHSVLSEEMINIYNDYPIGPYVKQINDMTDIYDSDIHKGFDITRDYTDVLLNNEYDLPVYTVFDEIKPICNIATYDGVMMTDIDWVTGEYYIDVELRLGRIDNLSDSATIIYPKGFYPQNLTRWCLDHEYIKIDDIKFYAKSGTCLKADHFKKFIEYCLNIELLGGAENIYQDSPESLFRTQSGIGKSLINHFIGWLNKKFSIKEKGCITDSFEIACGTFAEEIKKTKSNIFDCEYDCFINKVKNLYIIRSTRKEKLSQTSSPIWRHIIAGGIINLDKMHSKVCDNNTKVISYKVDAIFVENPIGDFSPIEDDKKKVGDITSENWSISGSKISIDKRKSYEIKVVKWLKKEYNALLDESNGKKMYKELQEGSYLCTGMSGSSKSTTLSNLYKDAIKNGKKIKVLCQTNKAVSVLKKKNVDNVQTFDSIFWNKNTGERDGMLGKKILKDYDGIWVDEYSMPSWILYSVLLPLKKLGIEIRLFGDNNQCSAIEEHGPEPDEEIDCETGQTIRGKYTTYKMYDYYSSHFIKSLCDFKCYEMKYIPKYGRYDDKLFTVVDYLMKNNRIHKSCEEKVEKTCYSNICYTNRKRWEINDLRYEDYKYTHSDYVPLTYEIKKKQCGKKMQKFIKWHKDEIYNQVWMKGVSVICNVNSKEKKVNCGERYYIGEIDHKKKMIKLVDSMGSNFEWFDLKYFSYNFEIGFCITVHRIQGDEMIHKFCIYQIDQMSKELFYTAIGRAKEFDKVFFKYTTMEFLPERVCNKSTIIKHCIKVPNADQIKGGNRVFEKDRKPKIQIVQDVHLNKKTFNIKEAKDMYIIQYREDGKKKNKKVRWGRISKEDAYIKILKIQKELF
jgi:hypothetical protein